MKGVIHFVLTKECGSVSENYPDLYLTEDFLITNLVFKTT
jgi:hypothetical protein